MQFLGEQAGPSYDRLGITESSGANTISVGGAGLFLFVFEILLTVEFLETQIVFLYIYIISCVLCDIGYVEDANVWSLD